MYMYTLITYATGVVQKWHSKQIYVIPSRVPPAFLWNTSFTHNMPSDEGLRNTLPCVTHLETNLSGGYIQNRLWEQELQPSPYTTGAIRCQTDPRLFYCLQNHSCRSSDAGSLLLANSTSAPGQHRDPMLGPPVPQP